MKTKKIGFIGGGRITKIFLQAFKNKSVEFDSIVVYDPNAATLNALKEQFPKIQIENSLNVPAQQELVILAVHPPVMMETLNSIKESLQSDAVILSLAPKFTISKIAGVLGVDSVIRMIPNATSFINEGFNPVSFHPSINDSDKQLFMNAFQALGENFEVAESKLEPYAIASAMLPTYFWFQWQKMEDIALKMGLSDDEAKEVVKSTLLKSINLFYDSNLTKEEVIDLIPVKPIGENEEEIKSILDKKLLGLFEKIKP
jgi:pyrroline-5-carboxylate reductase